MLLLLDGLLVTHMLLYRSGLCSYAEFGLCDCGLVCLFHAVCVEYMLKFYEIPLPSHHRSGNVKA